MNKFTNLNIALSTSVKNWRKFQKCLLPSLSGLDNGCSKASLKHWPISATLHSATPQKSLLHSSKNWNITFTNIMYVKCFSAVHLKSMNISSISINLEFPYCEIYWTILWVNCITGGKPLYLLAWWTAEWGRINLNEKYGSIADIFIKPLNFSLKLKIHIKHFFSAAINLCKLCITSHNIELSRYYSHIYTRKVSKSHNSWNQYARVSE
jgi:hypothetical protein